MADHEQEVPLFGAGLQDRKLVRVGDTVRRPAGGWTNSVHDLLRDLRARGYDLAPEPLGLDSAGREVLGYVEGRDPGWPFVPEILTEEGARQLGRLTSRLRSVLATYSCPVDARWQFAEGAPRSGETMQHGDLGPWNLLWGDGPEVVGVLDWDFAGPGDPWYDTGHLAWFTVPFMDDDRARARGFPEPPDRRSRLAAFAGGAGISAAELVGVTVRAQEEYERRVLTRGSYSCEGPWKTLLEMGFHKNARSDRAWTVRHFA
ncbi:phosphotransferase family protein [Actinopolymorpha singaporensis]|uniref:Phosphotransferase enzyme family protein n=1 Tax=Actinopolymorpha singaporensis TaxID=117157 RepID=A0A1H1NRA1_9ACTN|nr:phosphotransferase [Actinopolymorpha singaporensis]SDS01275.1 Phosphotransferase enzyme family protein [Actinopolymorpha singaporensis]